MAGDGSSIWMIVGARGDQALELGAQDRYERLRGGVARLVDLAGAVRSRPDSVYGPGSVTLSGRSRARAREAVLRDDAEPVRRGDRLEDLEPVLLVVPAGAEPPVCGERAGRRSGACRTPR